MAVADLNLSSSDESERSLPEEHIKIADQISIIRNEASRAIPDVGRIVSAVRELLNITKSHFQHEESVMLENHFPGMLLHKRDHDYLIRGLSDFMASVVDEAVPLSPAIGDNLQSWLTYHIKRYDDAYLEFRSRDVRFRATS